MAVSILDAPPFLWEVIDEYLFDLCEAWKLLWTETETAKVIVAESFNPDTMPLPGIIILSYGKEAESEDAPFGDGAYHISGMTYAYQIVICASFPDAFTAKRFASASNSSILDALRGDIENLVALSADNGEFVQRFEFGESELYVRGLAGQPTQGTYTGCSVLDLTVYTEI